MAILVVTAGCAANDDDTEPAAEQSVATQGGDIPPSTSRTAVLISLASDAPDGDVITADRYTLEEMEAYPQKRADVLEALAAETAPVLASVITGVNEGEALLVDATLPAPVRVGRSSLCLSMDIVYLDAAGDELVYVPAGLCGTVDIELVFEFGADGVEIADNRFILDPPDPSPEGTVAIDRRATRGITPGASLRVALDAVPEADIAPHPYGREWPALRPFVCFEVTIHSGVASPEGQVVPVVAISQGGEPVPVREPTDQNQPRVITQDPDSVVVWSFGPVDMGEHQPDSITVTASEGEIVSWDVSARHC